MASCLSRGASRIWSSFAGAIITRRTSRPPPPRHTRRWLVVLRRVSASRTATRSAWCSCRKCRAHRHARWRPTRCCRPCARRWWTRTKLIRGTSCWCPRSVCQRPPAANSSAAKHAGGISQGNSRSWRVQRPTCLHRPMLSNGSTPARRKQPITHARASPRGLCRHLRARCRPQRPRLIPLDRLPASVWIHSRPHDSPDRCRTGWAGPSRPRWSTTIRPLMRSRRICPARR